MYTYRYSREATVRITSVCPICRVQKFIAVTGDIEYKNRKNFTIDMLCCSSKHAQEYRERIKQAIKWARNAKTTRLGHHDTIQVELQHYNNISTRGESRYRTLAHVLANLGEYFPFNVRDK